VANWVSANDKPTTASKPVSGDVAEQRLKAEVMQLPPRDRHRIKGIQDDAYDELAREYQDSHSAMTVKPPDMVPASAGGFNKTSMTASPR
jgi:transcriptional coactivator HFI1/ADA1